MVDSQAVKKMKAIVKDSQHCGRVAAALRSFNMGNNFMDLCFVCAGNQKVYAHKLLLCTVSAQMKAVFMEIPDNTDLITVLLPDVDSRILSMLFDFLYEGSLRVSKDEYADFQDVKNLLGVVLTTPSEEKVVGTTGQPPVQPQPTQSQQQVQPSQLVYVPTAPNSQGQVQYMLATPQSLAQGQVLQGAVVQGGMAPQQPTSQPLMMGQNSGQIVQAGTQMVTTQVQQQVQVVQQNNAQVVPINNQMMATNQIVGGSQMMQCSSQMVVQGNQQALMNNNPMQVGMQNQVRLQNQVSMQNQGHSNFSPVEPVQQRPQYVKAGTRQYRQPATQSTMRTNTVRAKTVPQQTTRLNTQSINLTPEEIIAVLGEHDLETLTARSVRESLEQKLNVDLSDKEEYIDRILKSCLGPQTSVSDSDTKSSHINPKSKRKKNIPFCKSDDEHDEDFDPSKESKRRSSRRNK